MKESYYWAKKRIKEAGVEKFFYDRKILQQDVGSIGDFVSRAKEDVTYVGCWLSSSLGSQDLLQKISVLAKKGIVFTFCLITPASKILDSYASFFSSDSVSIRIRIEDSLLKLYDMKCQLPKEYRKNVQIYYHNELITTSFWLLDKNTESSKIQLDFKLPKTPRWFSFGMELNSKGSLYKSVKESYLLILDESKLLTDDDVEDINGIRQQKDQLKAKIKEIRPFDPNSPFIFISYSRKNDLKVWNDVLKIKEKYNCWIDFENLDGGRNKDENDWTQKVKPVLENKLCRGIVSYVSEAGFDSYGFIKECDWIKIKRTDFFVFLVDFSKDTKPSHMLEKIKDFSIENERAAKKQIRDEALSYVTQATLENKESYYHYSDKGEHLLFNDFTNWLEKVLKK